MSGRRRLIALALALLGLLSAPTVAAADPPSLQSQHIDNLFWIITAFAIGIGVFVGIALMWTVLKWRIRPGHKEALKNLKTERHRLETAWTVIPAVILLTIGLLAFQTLNFTDTVPAPQHIDVVITVIGHQWYWEFYVNWTANGTSLHLINQAVVFANQTIEFHVLGSDVAHSFFIHDLSFHLDAIPGHDNTGWLEPTVPGTYEFVCTQFCGVNHYEMFGNFVVLPT